jgi:hypothetical protein
MARETSKVADTRSPRTMVALTVILAMPFLSAAQTVTSVANGQAFEVRYTAASSREALSFGKLMGYDTVALQDGGCLNEVGWPMLPTQIVRIALPAGMAATDVRVVASERVELPGRYTVYPAQPPRRISDPATAADFVPPDPQAYGSSAPYPAQRVVLTPQTDLAGQGIALLRFSPVEYVPAEKKLFLYTSIDIVLEGTAGYVCGDYLPARVSEQVRDSYVRMIADMVVNPDDVCLRTADAAAPPGRGLEPGDYDYVIITSYASAGAFQPLANWKTKKGVPAKVVTTQWIYSDGGYSGSHPEKIRAFVQDAHAHWGATFFLLGGDTGVVPYQTRYLLGEWVPNDTYYGDYDDDWICEVYVGRASTPNTAAINTFTSKVLHYEKNPPPTDYAKTAAFFGFDLSQYGAGEGENMMKDIKTLYLPSGWTYGGVYDSDVGTHRARMLSLLNQGSQLFNHSDHSSTDVVGAGCINHGEYVWSSDMSSLTNGGRLGIFYTLGCWAGDYPSEMCVGEAFVRNTFGGGIAFIGNSRYGWYSPGYSDYYSARYDRYFFRAVLSQGHVILGEAFSYHKHAAYQVDECYQYIFTELTLLGDPEVKIWTSDPRTFTVEYPPTLTVGENTQFSVHVTEGYNPCQGARVCLWKAGDIYAIKAADPGGIATFSLTPASTGVMYVTVSKKNYFPYEGETDVVEDTCTLTATNEGQGGVVLDPPGGVYNKGTSVVVTAQADAGWRFVHWAGALGGSNNPTQILMDGDKTVTAIFAQLGDLNCDGALNAFDIDPFVLALSDPAGYATVYPDCNPNLADCNSDGTVDAFDIDAFVDVLTGP